MSKPLKPLFLMKDLYVNMDPGGIQQKNFVYALSKIGIIPEIYCKRTSFGFSLQDKKNIHFVKEIGHKYFSYLARRVFPDVLFLPDIERYTYLPFLLRKLSLDTNNDYDWIHSISYPCSSHLAGLYLKKKTKLPWVAQFYDPWVGNCYRNYKTKFLRKYDENIEYDIASNADIIIHTNEIIKNNWIKRYGKIVQDKIFVLPFCYDEKVQVVAKNLCSIKKDKISVLYVGNLYLNRNLDDLISAIRILQKTIKRLEDKIVFKFIGIVSKYDKENIKRNKLDDFFILLGQKPYNQLVDFYDDSDILLVIDAPATENLFFPSKLIEYFIHKKPILAISPKISTTHDILIESGHTSIENGSINEIVEFFSTLLSDYNSKLSFDYNYYKNYSPDLLAEKYIKLIEQRLFNQKM